MRISKTAYIAGQNDQNTEEWVPKHKEFEESKWEKKMETGFENIAKLQQDSVVKSRTIAKLEESLRMAKAENGRLENTYNDLRKQLKEERKKYQTFEEQNTRKFKMKTSQMQEKLREVEKINKILSEEKTFLKGRVDEMVKRENDSTDADRLKLAEEQLEESQRQLTDNERLTAENKLEMEKLEQIIQNSNETIVDQRKDISDLQQENHLLQAENDDLYKTNRDLDERMKEKNKEHQLQFEELKSKNTKLTVELNEMRDKVLEVVSANKRCQDELAQEVYARENCEQQLYEAREEAVDLRARVDLREVRIREYENKFELMQTEMALLRKDVLNGEDNEILRAKKLELLYGNEPQDERERIFSASSASEVEGQRLNDRKYGRVRDGQELNAGYDETNIPEFGNTPTNKKNGNDEAIGCLMYKVGYLENLCLESKQQIDYLQCTFHNLVTKIGESAKTYRDKCDTQEDMYDETRDYREHKHLQIEHICAECKSLQISILELEAVTKHLADKVEQLEDKVTNQNEATFQNKVCFSIFHVTKKPRLQNIKIKQHIFS
ncbi:uncharacterized protein LOC135690570 [Rhopilema esculentum]|uniref:uncharacterized protein LOC135690570 n=1 Tax=Rhopilema esculentum TaxID=499914 RepID=UPI0031CFDA03